MKAKTRTLARYFTWIALCIMWAVTWNCLYFRAARALVTTHPSLAAVVWLFAWTCTAVSTLAILTEIVTHRPRRSHSAAQASE